MKILFNCMFLFLSSSVSTSFVFSQGTFESSPAPSWVTTIEFDRIDNDNENPYIFLLADRQENAILEEDYFHHVIQVYNSDGIQEMSSISIDFDPSYQSVKIHEILVHRDNDVQSRAVNDFKILQRETDLQRALYDGNLTAVKELKDIRKGDIIEYTYTRTGYNPIYGDDNFTTFYQNYGIPIEQLYQSLIIDREMNIEYSDSAVEATLTREGQKWIYKWDIKDIDIVYEDNTVPAWVEQYAKATVTSMYDWREVVNWADKLYRINSSDKKKLRAKLKPHLSLSGSDEDIVNAVRFVQDEIRYLGFENGISAFKPHNPVDVLQQRFGDCKDKSFLLSTILQEMGIDAVPMLVHSSKGHSINERVPSPNQFNHCIVRLIKDNKYYAIDPTISNQGGNLDNITSPDYHVGLPIKRNNSSFYKFENQAIPLIISDEAIELDSVNGNATYNIITKYIGFQADVIRSYFNRTSRSDIKQHYNDYYINAYPSINITSLEMEDSSRYHKNQIIVKESYQIPSAWEEDDTHYNFMIYSLQLQDYVDFRAHKKDSMPYFLGDKIEYIQNVSVSLPDVWHIEDFKSKTTNKNFDYSYSVTHLNSNLKIKRRFYLKNEIAEPADINSVLSDADDITKDINYILTYNKDFMKSNQTNAISWQSWLIWLVSLIMGGLIGCWMLFKYDPVSVKFSNSLPLGGWIILPAIGLVLTPFIMIIQFYQFWEEGSYSSSVYSVVMSEFGFWAVFFLVVEGIMNMILFISTIFLIILLFKKRSNFPILISGYYFFSFLLLLGDAYFGHMFVPVEPILNKDVVKAFLSACIWIPYFQKSERVKNTFTRMLNPPLEHTSEEE